MTRAATIAALALAMLMMLGMATRATALEEELDKLDEVETTHGVTLMDKLKYPKDFSHLDYVNPDAPKGGAVRLAAIGTFDSLNPFILRGVGANSVGLLFDTLLDNVEDEASSEYGLLAESVRRPKDNRWVEYVLRPEAKFRDGSPVAAADVVWTFNMLREKGHPVYRAYYRDVEKAEAKDARTVRFTFKHGDNRELALILGQFPITSKAFYEKHDVTQPGLLTPMGSGPYEVAEAVPGKSIRYKRRDDYWGKNLPINRGRYNFDSIQVDYYRDETVAIEALKAGEYDFRQENIARLWAKAYDTPAIRSGALKKEEISHKIPTGMQGFIFNLRRDKFKNRLTREAITLAFNFEWANKNLFYSGYHRSLSYFSNSELASHGLPSEAELNLLRRWQAKLPPQLFTTPFSLPVNQEQGDMRANLIKAKELLTRAGWLVRNGQLVDGMTGEPFTIEFLIDMPSMERVLASLVQNLKRLGIDARIRLVDDAQYQKRLEQFDFDMVTAVIPQSMSPGNEQIDFWHSSKANVQGSRNLAGLQNPAVDALVESIVAAPNRTALVTATRALDRVLLNEYIAVPGWHLKSFRIIYWDKFGRPEKRPDYGLGFPHTWWSKSAEPSKP